jgi:hypothetical protein
MLEKYPAAFSILRPVILAPQNIRSHHKGLKRENPEFEVEAEMPAYSSGHAGITNTGRMAGG